MKHFVPEDKVSFQHSFKVESHHLDHLNHVNNIVYLEWVQEIAYLHWEALATNEMKATDVWVVLSHEINYLSQAYLNDHITVYTWIDETAGVKSTRIVHMYCNKKLLVKSKTIFCLLDKKTLRPKRVNEEVLELFSKKL